MTTTDDHEIGMVNVRMQREPYTGLRMTDSFRHLITVAWPIIRYSIDHTVFKARPRSDPAIRTGVNTHSTISSVPVGKLMHKMKAAGTHSKSAT